MTKERLIAKYKNEIYKMDKDLNNLELSEGSGYILTDKFYKNFHRTRDIFEQFLKELKELK